MNFKPIDGTFQNFNPVRRLFAGQTIGVDSVEDLGNGHPFFGAFLAKALGGTYGDSLIALDFL